MTRRVVLNTRPLEQAGELSRLLSAAGFLVVEAPAIAIVACWASSVLDDVRKQFASFTWVVLASQNAAHGLEDLLASSRVLCGTATATALNINPEIALNRFSATAAIDALRGRLTDADRVLVPRAAEGRDELVDGLRAFGALVETPIAYRTIAVDQATNRLREGGIDVVTLCSPSAVNSVRNAITHEVVVCLGDTTASAARALGLQVDGVARSTSMAALAEAVRTAAGVTV